MIYLTRVITINKGSSSLDEQIVLYKGDKNVEIQFVLKNNPFKQKNGTVSAYATYGQLTINRDAGPIISEVSQMSNNRVIFVITGDMIDGIEEIGDYDFQIRLFNEDQTSRVTLPPISNGIRIEEPLCEEATVSTTYVNSRRSVVMRASSPDEVFDEDGNYNRSNWNSGDIITDTKLNKIEEALYQINDNASNDYATEEFVEDRNRETRNYVESNYATTSYVDDQRRATERYAETYTDNAVGRIDLNRYATQDFVTSSIDTNNRYIENVILEDYATEEFVNDAIRNIEISGGVDLTGYATEAYVDQALTNYPTHKEMKSAVKDMVATSMPDVVEIRSSYLDNYFTEDDYKNGLCKAVLLSDVDFDGRYFRGELARMTLGWDKATSTRTATIESICGYTETYSIQEDGLLMRNSGKSFATSDTINSILDKRNYATQDYVNEMLGDIESLLGGI